MLVAVNHNEINLHKMTVKKIPLTGEYWSPEVVGESKRGFILGFEKKPAIFEGKATIKWHMIFIEQTEEGNFERIESCADRLVSESLQLTGMFIDEGGMLKNLTNDEGNIIQPPVKLGETKIQITFLGKKKNRSNNRMSMRFKYEEIMDETVTEEVAQ